MFNRKRGSNIVSQRLYPLDISNNKPVNQFVMSPLNNKIKGYAY